MLRSACHLALAAAMASSALLTVPAGSALAASAVHYAALGDSSSAGVGAEDYIASSGSCQRSPNAASALWADAHDPASYVSVACGGAGTGNVISTQLPALSDSTTLVTLTAGGNDVSFEDVMLTCNVLFFVSDPCLSAVSQADSVITSDLPAEYDQMLAGIKADAPDATVIVLGYPDFFDLSAASCSNLSAADRTAIDHGVDLIDEVIQAAAATYGDIFADVRPDFSGHEICDGTSWINTIDWTEIGASYHPTAAGQSGGFLPALTAAVTAAAAKKS